MNWNTLPKIFPHSFSDGEKYTKRFTFATVIHSRIKTKLGLMLWCKQGRRPIIVTIRDWRQYSISIAIVWKHALSKGKLLSFQKILVCSHTGLFQEWAIVIFPWTTLCTTVLCGTYCNICHVYQTTIHRNAANIVNTLQVRMWNATAIIIV